MSRRNRPPRRRRAPGPPPDAAAGPPLLGGWMRREERGGRVWLVRSVSGSAATKTYRCPHCRQEIPPGVPHVVVWPAEDGDSSERRHWHTGCWGRGR